MLGNVNKIIVVDNQDQVVGAVPEAELYEHHLTHRIVHVLLFTPDQKILLQKRSATKSFAPGFWVTSAGGRVEEGESYLEAAQRELHEEIGLDTELTELGKEFYTNAGLQLSLFMTVFTGQYQGESLTLQTSEVAGVDFFTLSEIKEQIAAGGKFTDELKFIIEKFY